MGCEKKNREPESRKLPTKIILTYRKDGILATVDGVKRIYSRNETILQENSIEFC